MSSSADRVGFRIGHWTDSKRRTGCTTILFDQLVPAVVDVRGGAPGTRETDLLAPDRMVGKVDAIFLTGGSAHGLSAAEGVMQYLRENGRGVPTSTGSVPIVTAAVIYDLAVGEPVWPTAADAYASCLTASPMDQVESGSVGAGTGATYRKAWPALSPLPGGFGLRSIEVDGLGTIHAVTVVNAIGDVGGRDTDSDQRLALLANPIELDDRSATTLVALIIEGDADARTLRRVAIAAHDGMARTIRPCHTQWDGDLVYATLTGSVTEISAADSFRWAVAAELAVESAIRNAVEPDPDRRDAGTEVRG